MLSVLPDAVVTNAATPVTINVLANDSGNNLTITSFSSPANGSLVFNGDKTFTYTPAAGFIGDDSFAYTVRDAQGTPASAEVTISVIPSTGATVATDDVVEVVADGSVIVPVLANDMAADGGALQITAISMPGHGVVNVLPDQTIRYVPQSGFNGIDSFTYTVTDGQGRSASATVTVKVLARNSPPIAAADTFPVEAGQPTLLAVLANDSDPEGGPLQVVGFTMPSHGSLVFNPDRTFTYTPAAGFLGQDQFTYTIRDNRGASAVATVTLVVAEVSQSPVAVDDQVTTEAGQPVTIDVLANDTLPAGQQVAIVAVTLPFRGKLAFNPDKTIIYTPNPGFVGIDDFTYTISNGKGGTAKAKVTIEVTTATIVDTYANGYGHRRRIVVPASSARGSSHENFPLWVELSGAWLRSASNGGKVASAEGHDLRFELADGTKLAHELELYDAVAGRLGAWVRVPELSGSSATILFLYYDKPGLTQSEGAPAAVWQDYLAVWHLPGGVNAGGAARSLTATGTIASSAEGLGAGALSLDGNGVLSIADASWLSGLSALSVQLRSKAYSTGHNRGQLNAGSFDSDASSDLVVRYQAAGWGEGQPTNVIHTKFRTSAGNVGITSAANRQTAEWQNIVITWETGDQHPDLYLNGRKTNPSFTNQITEPATTLIAGPLYVGAGPRDSATGGWVGLIDEVRFCAARFDDAWIAAEHINQSTPALFIGVGDEEAPTDAASSVVAVPFIVQTKAGHWVDIDVLAAAVLGAGAGSPTIQAVSQPGNGTISTIDGKVRYTPVATFVGRDSFTYTLAAAGKTSTARIDIVVETSTSVEDDNPEPNTTYLRTVNVANSSQLTNALSNALAGDDIVLGNGTYSGSFTLAKDGTAEHPIRLRAANAHQATLTDQLTLSGRHNVALRLRAQGSNARFNVVGMDCKVLRCRFFNTAQISGAINIDRGADRAEVAYNAILDYANRAIRVRGGANNIAKFAHIHHNYIKNSSSKGADGTAAIIVGEGKGDSPRQPEALIEYNLVEDHFTGAGCVEAKSSRNIFRFNTLRNCQSRLESRHGSYNDFIGNALINSGGPCLWGSHHRAIGNFNDGQRNGQWSDIGPGRGDGDWSDFPTGSFLYPRADNCLMAGNIGNLRLGVGAGSFPALNSRIEQHTGSITTSLATGTTGNASTPASVTVPPYVVLQPEDVGPEANSQIEPA